MTFKAPDGNVDLMCISMPVFPVNNAEDFIALNKAAQASPPGTPSLPRSSSSSLRIRRR